MPQVIPNVSPVGGGRGAGADGEGLDGECLGSLLPLTLLVSAAAIRSPAWRAFGYRVVLQGAC